MEFPPFMVVDSLFSFASHSKNRRSKKGNPPSSFPPPPSSNLGFEYPSLSLESIPPTITHRLTKSALAKILTATHPLFETIITTVVPPSDSADVSNVAEVAIYRFPIGRYAEIDVRSNCLGGCCCYDFPRCGGNNPECFEFGDNGNHDIIHRKEQNDIFRHHMYDVENERTTRWVESLGGNFKNCGHDGFPIPCRKSRESKLKRMSYADRVSDSSSRIKHNTQPKPIRIRKESHRQFCYTPS